MRSGQAKRPTVHKGTALPPEEDEGAKKSTPSNGRDFDAGDEDGLGKASSSSSKTSFFDSKEAEEIDPEEVVEEAKDEFKTVVKEQILSNNDMLMTAKNEAMSAIRTSLQDLLSDGDIFGIDEIDELGKTILLKLSEDVENELERRTTELLQEKVENMEDAVDLDTEGELNPKDEAVDLANEEQDLAEQVRNGVDAVFLQVKEEIKHRAAVILKSVLETALKEKTKHTYIVEIDNDNMVGYKRRSSSSSSHHTSSSSSGQKSSTGSSGHHSSSSKHKSSSSSHHKSSSSSGHKSSSSSHHTTTKKDAEEN